MRPDTAQMTDAPALQQLFISCFGDSKSYTDLYFKHCFHPENVFVLRQENAILAMTIAFTVPYIAEDGDEQAGAYLYAVATEPSCRGRGYCRKLLQYAENCLHSRSIDFTCLKPGSPELVMLYSKLGYCQCFTARELPVKAATVSGLQVHPIDEKRYFNLRQLLLQESFLAWQQEELAHQRRLCLHSGGALLELSDDNDIGCAACEFDGKNLIVKEFLGKERWLPGVCEYTRADTAIARLPGNQAPFAMAKSLSGKALPSGWLGFAFD